jgi:RNA polymerase sigma factor (TIGR02999 family)
MADPSEVTLLLAEARGGNREALDALMPLVHAELRAIASRYLGRERVDHTLQPTALVNEAYLRLVDQREMNWHNRAHFFAIAANLMRRILIDHARAHTVAKRGGGARKVSLDEAMTLAGDESAELVALDEALRDLAAFDERKSRVVELRFFGGLSAAEAAEVLGVSEITVHRDWAMAKAWLQREMSRRADDGA